MDFTELFGIYYGQYRGEATPPEVGDDEWTLAIRNYNSAVLRMQMFDDTKWNFLYNTLLNADDGDSTITSSDNYEAPSDMAEPGGFILLSDTAGNRQRVPLIQPYEQQAIADSTLYGYFVGDQHQGFTLYLNGLGTADVGKTIDYVYYRNGVRLDPDTEDGTTLIEGGDPAFYINHMLANRLTPDENFSVYQIAKRDAEEALKNMKLKNNSGSHYNTWRVQDTGPGFGNAGDSTRIFGR